MATTKSKLRSCIHVRRIWRGKPSKWTNRSLIGKGTDLRKIANIKDSHRIHQIWMWGLLVGLLMRALAKARIAAHRSILVLPWSRS